MYDMYTINVQELDLSSFDNKRYIVPNILARGHYAFVKKWAHKLIKLKMYQDRRTCLFSDAH